MTCGLQDKGMPADGGMSAAFDQNKSIYFENQARYRIIVGEFYI
jgi:hypothetical protein